MPKFQIILTCIILIFILFSSNIIKKISSNTNKQIINNIIHNESIDFNIIESCKYPKGKDLINIKASKNLNETEIQNIIYAKCIWETIIENTVYEHPGIYVNITVEDLDQENNSNTIAVTNFENNLIFHTGLFHKLIMPYNSTIILNKSIYREQNLIYTIVHELGHALGFENNIWKLNGNMKKNNYEYTGKHAVKNFNKIFNTNYTSIQLNNGTNQNPDNNHWKRLDIVDKYGNNFKNDIMTPYIVNKQHLSMVTIGTLQDNGYIINPNLCIDDSDCSGKCIPGFINICQ
jgi:hypothetical protein